MKTGTIVAARYRVIDRLGAGGMAVVYRAHDPQTGHDMALKVMTEALLDDAEAQRRFKAEHRVMAALEHPGIPAVHDPGLTAEGLPFFAMELVTGDSLEHLGPLPEADARTLLAELLPVLGHLHRRGLVHGDLKGENVMRTTDGRLKLMDFGLAGPAGARPHGLEGTVTHLAPELIQRGKADQRSDLYAVGVMLYKWLTGRLPIEGASPGETLKLHMEAVPASPRRHVPDLTPAIEGVVMRLLAKRPQDRYQSANEVLVALGLPADEEDALAMPLQGPFVGRQELLGDLIGAVGQAAQGHRPKPLMLAGAPGLGKTRLLEELSAQARLMDLPVVIGRCPGSNTPYGAWIDLGRDLLAQGRGSVPERAAALQAALAPFTGGTGASADDAPQALRFALAQLLEGLATGRGLVVALDDWDQADTASVALLNQLLSQGERWPVFWIGTAKVAEGTEAPAFPGEARTLAPLAPEETALLVAANLGVSAAELPAEISRQIHESTRGNPRFVEDLLRYLLAQKRLVKKQVGWTLIAGEGGALPSGLQALYQARFDELTPDAQALATTLAIASLPLARDVVATAAGLTPDAAEDTAAELERRQLLATGPDLALSDGQLAAWIVQRTEDGERARRHGAIATSLSSTAGEHPPLPVLNALAHHGLASPEPAIALRWLIEAARQNVKVKALAIARRFGQAAHEMSANLPNHERIEVLEVLSTAHRGLDEADAALAYANEAVELAKTLGSAELLARSYNGLGKIHQLASRYDEAKGAFEAAAGAAGEEVPLELARSHRAMARLVFFAGDLDAAYSHGRQALRLARRHAGPVERAQVLAEIGETFQGEESRLQEGLACLEEAMSIARELQNPHLESMAAAGLGNLHLGLGQLAGARASFERAASLFETIGNSGEAIFARLNLALVAEEQGRFADAEVRAAEVAATAKSLNRKFPMAAAMATEGASQVMLGRSVEGLRRLAEAAAVADEIKHKYVRAVIRQLESAARLMLGHFEEARAEAKALAEFGASAGVADMVQRAKLIEAEITLQQGRADEMAELVEPLLHDPHAGVRLRAHLLRAEASIARRDEATGYQALHAARALLPEVDAPRQEAELMLLEAELDAMGGGEEGAASLEAAIKLLEDTQQRHLLVRALGVASRIGPAKGRKAAQSRGRELATSLASALGKDGDRYLDAYGRRALLVEHVVAMDMGGPVPSTLAGLRDLARRLEQGLAMVESSGGLADGDHALTRRRLDQVVGFANAVNSSLKLDTVMDRALALVIEISGAERGLLLLKEGGNLGTQKYQTAPGFADDGGGGEQYSRTVARTVLETGETVCVLDALSDQRFAQQASVMGLNLQTIICVPLKDQQDVIGAIYVDRQGLSDQFATSDLETVQALSALTAQAIVNAKLMRQQEERQVHLEMLNRLSRTLSRTLELEKVLDLIADITIEVTKAERTFILLVENDQLVFGAGRDQDGPLPPQAGREMSRSVCQKVMDTQQGVFVMDAGNDEEFSAKRSVINLRLNSVVAVPLIGQSGITGVLYVDSRSRVVGALEKEVSVLTAIANTAALAVDNARLYRQATVDGLTGLYVRSFFLMRMDEEIRRTRRFGGKFSLLVMDIDHFKKFNDTYGHATGDAVLKQVAKTIRDCVRVGLDLPCRYGGEEMVVLLPETDTPGALVTAERIRREIETGALVGPEGEQLHVTISIGIATFPAMAETASDLFERADQALYVSKHGGRNRSTVYEAEVRSS